MELIQPRLMSLVDISAPVLQKVLMPFLDTKERVSLSRTHSSFYDRSFLQDTERRLFMLKEVLQNVLTREESLTDEENKFFRGIIMKCIHDNISLDFTFTNEHGIQFTPLSVVILHGNTYLIKKIIQSGVSLDTTINGLTYLEFSENIRTPHKRIPVQKTLIKFIAP